MELYRSIWIEDPENRKKIFDNDINVLDCPNCKDRTRIEFPFLATNVKRKFAVWYEPIPDPAIDADIQQYASHFGNDSFYAKAPRIRNWDAFKTKITELESSLYSAGKAPNPSPEMQRELHGFVEYLHKSGQVGKTSPVKSFSRVKREIEWLKQERITAAMLLSLLPFSFILIGESAYSLFRAHILSIAAAFVGTIILWLPLKKLILWLKSGSGIPVTTKHQVGVERLGILFGCVISAPLAGVMYWSWISEEYSGYPRNVIFLPAVFTFGFLGGKLLIRGVFWVVDGFKL